MKQWQSGHAVKGPAYGCSHINEVRVTELTKTGVTVKGERPAVVPCRREVRASHSAAAGSQIVAHHLRDSGSTFYRESMLVLG